MAAMDNSTTVLKLSCSVQDVQFTTIKVSETFETVHHAIDQQNELEAVHVKCMYASIWPSERC